MSLPSETPMRSWQVVYRTHASGGGTLSHAVIITAIIEAKFCFTLDDGSLAFANEVHPFKRIKEWFTVDLIEEKENA